MKKLIHLVIISLILFSCGSKTDTNETTVDNSTTKNISNEKNKPNPILIKDGSISFETSDIEKTYSKIKTSINLYGAYISEEKTDNNDNNKGYEFIIRVPSQRFDSLISHIIKNANIKELENKSTQIKDVTEEYIDLEARIKVKKEYEIQLLELLKKAKNLAETIEIQKQLNELRIEIEASEGKLKLMNDLVNYSTLTVSFYEESKYSSRFFSEFWDAIISGWQVFLQLLNIITYLWVVILVFFLGRWGYKYYRKRNINKKQE